MREIRLNQENKLSYNDGSLVNTRDYLLTREYIPRYYDFHTKNTSAINLHVLLKKLGIKNNKEHLQIFDPTLIGVDPWDPVLTDDIKVKIMKECMINHWYVYREVLRVNDGADPFDINIGNYTVIYLMLRNQSFFYEASRQLGKTETIATQMAIEFNFCRNLKMANVHYDSNMAANNMKKIEEKLQQFPDYLQFWNKISGKADKKTGNQTVANKRISGARKEIMTADLFHNTIQTMVVGQDKRRANNTGRGTTIGLWFIDEWPHIKFNDIAYNAFNSATKTASEVSKEKDLPFGIRSLGTPGDLKTDEGKWMHENIMKNYIPINEFALDVLDMCEDEIRDWASRKSSTSSIFHVKFDFDKIGMDAKWFASRCMNQEIEAVRSEILLRWEEKGNQSPYPLSALNNLTNSMMNTKMVAFPIYELGEEYEMKIYPKESDSYTNWENFFLNYRDGVVIGMDVANGSGGDSDSTALVFVDSKTARIIATTKFNNLSTNDQRRFVIYLMEEVFNRYGINMTMAIERNGPGVPIIEDLITMPHTQKYLMRFPVVRWKLTSPDARVDLELRDKNGNVQKYDFGYNVNTKTRDILMEVVQQLVIKHTNAIAVPDLVEEIKSLVYVKTASKSVIKAAPGRHDDMVMATAHAYNCIFNHVDILKYYGIIIDPDSWVITEQQDIFTMANRKFNGRITTTFEEIGGIFTTRYFDNKSGRYVTKEQAEMLMKDEQIKKHRGYIMNTETHLDYMMPDEEIQYQFNDRVTAAASSNVKVISQDDYEMYKRGLKNENTYMDMYSQLNKEFNRLDPWF